MSAIFLLKPFVKTEKAAQQQRSLSIVAYFQENLKRASGFFRKNIEKLPCGFHNGESYNITTGNTTRKKWLPDRLSQGGGTVSLFITGSVEKGRGLPVQSVIDVSEIPNRP